MMSKDMETTKIREIIEGGIHNRLGDGRFHLILKDHWCCPSSLKNAFPRLFLILLQKEHYINQIGEWHDWIWNWNIKWRRRLYE